MDIWLILTILAALAAAIYTFLDNYIVDVLFKGRTPQAQKAFFGPAYIVTAVLVAIFAGLEAVEWQRAVMLVISGALASISYIPYYIALGKDEATNVTIFEQLSPIFYLILGCLILGDSISVIQLAAFGVILMSPLVLIFSAKRNSKNSRTKTMWLMVVKVIISSLGCVLAVKFGSGIDTITMLFYVMLGKGLCDVILMLMFKKWRKRFNDIAKREKNKAKFFGIFLIDHVVWLVSDFTYYIALTLAPAVAMVSAVTKSLQPILVFVLGIILTILWPKFGREKNDRRTIIAHFVATLLAVVGIILLQM